MYAVKQGACRVGGVLIAATAAVALPAPSLAGAARPAQVSPKKNAVLEAGTRPVFTVRDRSRAARKYGVFITISTSKARKRGGDLKKTKIGTFAQMKRRGSTYRYRPADYTFPTWFMVRPDTYYWQAYRIDCSSGKKKNCHVLTKVRRFRVSSTRRSAGSE